MTVKVFATSHCDKAGCKGTATSKQRDEWCLGSPKDWGEVNWQEPPPENKKYESYETAHLCPDHLNALLKWMATEDE